jgi:hypothetical protein
MGSTAPGTDDVDMPLAIRCHPFAPVEVDEIESWLEREMAHVREDVSGATVRLLRLTQRLPSGGEAVGWLIEFEVDRTFLEGDRLAAILCEMRLLGLQPTVLETSRRRRTRLGTAELVPGDNGGLGAA